MSRMMIRISRIAPPPMYIPTSLPRSTPLDSTSTPLTKRLPGDAPGTDPEYVRGDRRWPWEWRRGRRQRRRRRAGGATQDDGRRAGGAHERSVDELLVAYHREGDRMRARAGHRRVHAARPFARLPLCRARRAARRSRPGGRRRADQGGRPVRRVARRRVHELRRADDRRRDPTALPRQGVGDARPTEDQGVKRPPLTRARRSHHDARPVADDRGARRGCRRSTRRT